MKKGVLLIAVLIMVALLAGAVVWDCVGLAEDAQHRVSLADEEIAKHERRLMKLLESSPQVSPEVEATVAAYRGANSLEAKRAAYDDVVANFRRTMAGSVDATNPLDRKFMDDVAGAINRREVAEKPYEEELAAYEAFMNTWRGGVARWFLPADGAAVKAEE
ncbi:MAG: hypothetical protein WD851_08135 [Pirellulales bacterium]